MIRSNHRNAWVFGGFLAFLLLLTYLQRPWEKIETDILMFLNSGNLKQNQQIIAELDQFQSNRSSFLLCAADFGSVHKAALLSENALISSGLFTEVSGRLQAGSTTRLINFYQKYLGIGQNLEVAKILGMQDAGTQLFQRQQKLLMQFGSLSSQLKADPLLLRSDFPDLTHLKFGAFAPRQDWLTLQSDNEQCIFLSAMNKESAFDAEYQDRFLKFYDQWKGQLHQENPDIKLTALSLVRFAALSKQGIQEDLVKVTLGSLAGIGLFLTFIFRGTRPFWASQIPLIGGAICGISAVLIIYSKIHLIALALGATLTGVAIDYVFHYLAQWRFKNENWNSATALREVLPGINLGLITSLIGYAAFFLAPVEGIQQTAIIAIFGLVGAYVSLIVFFPVIFEKPSKTPPDSRLINGTQISLNFWARYGLPVSLVTLVGVIGYLILGLPKVNDDIRTLNGMPPSLKAEAQHFVELSKMPDMSRFLLVTREDPEELLQLLESLREDLDKLQQDQKIMGFLSSTSLIPSKKQQLRVFQSTQKALAEHRLQLEEQLISFGFETSQVDQYFLQWEAPPATLSLREWLAHPVSKPWRNMWVVGNNRFATAIYLGAGFDQKAVEGLTREGVFFVDRTGEISRTFGEHRSATQGVLISAYAFIFYILLIHLGLRDAFWITLPPFAGILNLLAVVKFFSIEINLFYLLSMILILGIGIDYSIFFYHSSKRQLSVTTIAVLASLITTLLAFGALGISTLPALQAFGLSLPIGLCSAFLFGPLTQKSYRGFLPEMPKVIIWLGSVVRMLHITVFCGFAFVLFAAGGVVLAYLFFPLAKLVSRKTIRLRAIRQRLVQLSFRAYYFYLNIFGLIKGELNTKELEKIKSNRVVFVANHPTLLDFVLLASALPKVVCIVKLGVWNNPFLSRLARGMGYIPFTTGQDVLDLGIKRIQEDFPILIFPEGTRSPAGELGEFSKGAAYIALASEALIVPVSMSISAPILMKGWKWWQVMPHRVTMTAEFHPAMPTKELLVECDGNLSKASRQLTRNLVDFFSQKIHTQSENNEE